MTSNPNDLLGDQLGEQLVRYAAGGLDAEASRVLEAHVRSDADCAARLRIAQFMVGSVLGPLASEQTALVPVSCGLQSSAVGEGLPAVAQNPSLTDWVGAARRRRPLRRLLKLAACVTLILTLSGLAYAGYAWWTAPLFADDFKSGWFDSRKWRAPPEIIKEGGVFAEKGHIRLINRGYLVTNHEFKEPIEVSFEWKWSQLGIWPQYADILTVALRTTGKPRPRHTFEVQDGIMIKFDAALGNLRIQIWEEEMTFHANLPVASLPMPAEDWHRIRIMDDGDNVSVYIDGAAIPEHFTGRPIVRKSISYRGLGNHVALYNREMLAKIPHESTIRDFVIRPLK